MSNRKTSDPGERQLGQDESELWTKITRSIKPLRRPLAKVDASGNARASTPKPKPKPAGPIVVRDESAKPTAKPGFPLAPITRRTRQKLARGTEPIDARIDLHGLTQSQAHHALLHFLRRAQGDGHKFVLVITGKGRMRFEAEREAGVLRREVPRWLRLEEFRDYVVGYERAHVGHGGEGALYVRLRRPRS
jgi:DNA-nicking Smr family endonuclease